MKRPYKEECLRWFTQAKDEFLDAEKALKAYLYLNVKSIEVFYTHSIDELMKMVLEIDPDFKEVAAAKKLDKYYIQTRYPNGLPGGVPSRYFDDPVEAEEAGQLTKNVIELVERKIKEKSS